MKTWMTASVAVLACLLATSADAVTRDREKDRGKANVFLRGGVNTYTGDIDAFTASGPSWGVILNMQPLNMLGFEVGYDASRNALTDDRLGNDANIMRNGGSALFKFAPPLIERVKPFVGAGLGATFVSVQGETDGLYRNDLMQEVPLTAGIEFNSGALHAGVRGTYRVLVDEDFVDEAAPGVPQGGMVEGSLTLGARF